MRQALVFAAICVLCASHAPAATICFEAELADDMTFPFEIGERAEASGGLALAVPEGIGDSAAFGGAPGQAVYHVLLPERRRYSIWLRVRWHDACGNSIALTAGDAKPIVVADSIMRRWHWVKAGRPIMPAGWNRILLENREDGVAVDQIALAGRGLWTPPQGTLATTTVPGPMEAPGGRPRLFVSAFGAPVQDAAADARPGLTPHKAGVTPLERIQTVALIPGRPVRVVAWLRSVAGLGGRGHVRLETAAPIDIRPTARQGFGLHAGAALGEVAFDVAPARDTPRRSWPLRVVVTHDDSFTESRQLRLVRPWQWLVTDAFDCPRRSGIDTPGPVEERLRSGFSGGAVGWRVAPDEAFTPYGLLDMRSAVGNGRRVMAYAFTRVHSPKAGEFLLDVRHDDMVRVWLNGSVVLTSRQAAPSVASRKLVRVRLKEGDNDLLVKICQLGGCWEFGASFLTVDHQPAPVRGLAVAFLP